MVISCPREQEDISALTHGMFQPQNPHAQLLATQVHVLTKMAEAAKRADEDKKSDKDKDKSGAADASDVSPLTLFGLRAMVPTLLALLETARQYDKEAVIRVLAMTSDMLTQMPEISRASRIAGFTPVINATIQPLFDVFRTLANPKPTPFTSASTLPSAGNTRMSSISSRSPAPVVSRQDAEIATKMTSVLLGMGAACP